MRSLHASTRTSLHGIPWRWLLLTCLALAVVTFDPAPGEGDVFRIYRDAAMDWRMHRELYGGLFLYSPTSAAAYAPFTWLDVEHAGALWRAFNLAVFWGAGALLLRRSGAPAGSHWHWVLPVMGWSAARHGQATLAMAGWIVVALEAARERRHLLSGAALALAVTLKPLALVALPGLLLLRPRAGLAALLVIAWTCAASMVLAPMSYAAEQWVHFYGRIVEVSRSGHESLPHLFSLLSSLGWTVSYDHAQVVRVLAGALALLWVAWRMRSASEGESTLIAYGAFATYCLLFSPRTENNTYALLAPVVAVLGASTAGTIKWYLGAPFAFVVLYSSTRTLSHWNPSLGPEVTRPALCLLCWVLLVRHQGSRKVDAKPPQHPSFSGAVISPSSTDRPFPYGAQGQCEPTSPIETDRQTERISSRPGPAV